MYMYRQLFTLGLGFDLGFANPYPKSELQGYRILAKGEFEQRFTLPRLHFLYDKPYLP